jgi:predicted enzyme related to lactoylglutathione lyase
MAQKHPVVHFELPVDDRQRAADFYKNAFGWDAHMLGDEFGSYTTVMTTETDEQTQRPTTPGAINGGFYKKSDVGEGAAPTVVIAVDDINDAMQAVEAAGGKVLGGSHGEGKPDDIPGVGLYIAIIDTEGNRVAILQPKGM